MASLTDRRFEKALPILEKYRDRLNSQQGFDAGSLERELRELWGVGYQELKGIMEDLLKRDGFIGVAAHYMEHSNTPGVVSEFKGPLAKLYRIKSYDHADKLDEARAEFWKRYHAASS